MTLGVEMNQRGTDPSIERDYLQIYRLLFDPTLGARPDAVSVQDAVVAVKRWFHGQTERPLVVLDSADAIDNGDDESYLNLEIFLPDTPAVDIIITTRYALNTVGRNGFAEGQGSNEQQHAQPRYETHIAGREFYLTMDHVYAQINVHWLSRGGQGGPSCRLSMLIVSSLIRIARSYRETRSLDSIALSKLRRRLGRGQKWLSIVRVRAKRIRVSFGRRRVEGLVDAYGVIVTTEVDFSKGISSRPVRPP
jgi:hypothetical protein